MTEKLKKECEGDIPIKYSKGQLTSSAQYADKRDILNAILKDGSKYTLEQAGQALENFMKGKVK